MKPICAVCGRFVTIFDLPMFFVATILLEIMEVDDAKYVCSKCLFRLIHRVICIDAEGTVYIKGDNAVPR